MSKCIRYVLANCKIFEIQQIPILINRIPVIQMAQ